MVLFKSTEIWFGKALFSNLASSWEKILSDFILGVLIWDDFNRRIFYERSVLSLISCLWVGYWNEISSVFSFKSLASASILMICDDEGFG